MRKLIWGLVVVAVVGTFVGTAYYLYRKSQKPARVWETGSPARSTIIKKTVATGSVVPRREVAIKPQVSGIVDAILVEAGARVEKGDPIARIRLIPNVVSLSDARTRIRLAQIALDNAKRELARNQKLRTEGAIADAMLQEFVLGHANAAAELDAAVDHLELLRKGTTAAASSETNTVARATITGTVLEVPLEVGASVIESNTFNDGTTIAIVADMNELIFKGKVDESEVGKIRPGMDLVLTIGAIAERRFDAVLEHIAPKGKEENGAIQFEIRAALKPIQDADIRANLSANADIVLARRDDVIAIDEGLLQFDDGKPFVEVETGPQVFSRRDVETGLSDGIKIEIVSGVTEGDKIKNADKGAGI